MTNIEKFKDTPLHKVIEAYEDADNLTDNNLGLWDWLYDFEAFTDGHKYAWDWKSREFVDVTDLLSVLDNPKPVTGYLLELRDRDSLDWTPCEFDCGIFPDFHGLVYESLNKDWYDHDTQVGFFPDLGGAWLSSSEDWDFRLGADFNAETTPTERPSPIGIWGGEQSSGAGFANTDLWRVRKVTTNGVMSEKAQAFFRKYPILLKDFPRG